MAGATPAQVARAYLLARDTFGFVPLWHRIEALDNQVADALQSEMIIEGTRLLTRAVAWFARSSRLGEPMDATIARMAPAVKALRQRLAADVQTSPRAAAWQQGGVPAALAVDVALLGPLYAALDVAEVAESTQSTLDDVANIHAGVGRLLGLTKVRALIDQLPSDSYWQSLAKAALGDDLAGLQRAICLNAVRQDGTDAAVRLSTWEARNAAALERAHRMLADFGGKSADLAMLSVALRELRNLA
jgi:glutamate dehydrogenase